MAAFPFEQALHHAVASKHSLPRASEVAARIMLHHIGFDELFDPIELKPAGNVTQLWTIGQHKYFSNPSGSYL